MSTIPKEIIEKIDDILVDYYHCDTYPRTRAVEDICELFSNNQLATDGREELEKENVKIDYNQREQERGKPVTEKELNVVLSNQITALQSQCTEKDQEIERLKNASIDEEQKWWKEFDENAQKSKQIEELKAENERLKGELKYKR